MKERSPEKRAPEVSFEPFNSPQNEANYFQNNYNGNFSDRLSLNRVAVERFCELADFEGEIHLSTTSRMRGSSYQSLGETAIIVDKGLTKPKEKSDNPYCKVTSIPQGWLIAINDQEITKAILEKKSQNPVEDQFVSFFNNCLRQGLSEASTRELASGEKRPAFKKSLAITAYYPLAITTILADNVHNLGDGLIIGGLIGLLTLNGWGMYTGLSELVYLKTGIKQTMRDRDMVLDNLKDALKTLTRPPMPVDNLIASNVYLETKGRTLVKKQ